MRRFAIPLAVPLAVSFAGSLAAVGIAVAPASAADGQHGCPPPFRPITLEDAYTLPHYAGLTHEEIATIFAALNRNGDLYLCLLPLPLKDGAVNLIDNNAAIR